MIYSYLILLTFNLVLTLDLDDLELNSGILLGVQEPQEVGLLIDLIPDKRKFPSRRMEDVPHYGRCNSYMLSKKCSKRAKGSLFVDGASIIHGTHRDDSGGADGIEVHANRFRLFYDRFYVDLNIDAMKENRLSLFHYTGRKFIYYRYFITDEDKRSKISISKVWLNHTIKLIKNLDEFYIGNDPDSWIKTSFKWKNKTYVYYNSTCYLAQFNINSKIDKEYEKKMC